MIAAALQLAAAFNLVCGGTLRSGPLGLALPEADGAPISVTYRVDLVARLWCSGDCETPEPIAAIEGEIVTLRERHYSDGSEIVMVYPEVGRFSDTRIEGDVATLRSGRCEAAPFTGFPGLVA